jgi:predicted transcriptional regulator of viral defense system
MAKKSLKASLGKIKQTFENEIIRSFNMAKFVQIYSKYKYEWNLPTSATAKRVLDHLIDQEVLIKSTYFDSSGKDRTLYSLKYQDDLTIISGIKSSSYYAFYTALFLHQLTLQIPKTYYVNYEHTSQMRNYEADIALTQNAIDLAFIKGQRKSSNNYIYGDKRVIITNGKHTGKLGVIRHLNLYQSFEYTDLERTLIDIAVRPVYAGGIAEVLEAFKVAKNKIDIDKLNTYLTQLSYKYPYHQVIGFYLEKANYEEAEINYFKKDMRFDFYLTYDIRNKEYSNKWRLYYPKGF